ncbi:MAG: hypothetical protein RIR06_161 [Bacteroidota bacterium]
MELQSKNYAAFFVGYKSNITKKMMIYTKVKPEANAKLWLVTGWSTVPLSLMNCSNNLFEMNQLNPNKTGATAR